MGILGNLAIGLGEGAKTMAPYIKNMQDEEIQTLRDNRMAALQAQRDAKQEEYASAREGRQMTHAEKLQKQGFEHAETLQTEGHAFQSSEGDKNRNIQERQLTADINYKRSMLGIAGSELKIKEATAKIEDAVKQIGLDNAKEVEKLKKEYSTATDPAAQERIKEHIQILTGKDNDKYLPVPLKDEMGNITGYKIFDKNRGEWKADSSATGSPKPPPISERVVGQIYSAPGGDRKWTGSGWEAVTAKPATSSAGAGTSGSAILEQKPAYKRVLSKAGDGKYNVEMADGATVTMTWDAMRNMGIPSSQLPQ